MNNGEDETPRASKHLLVVDDSHQLRELYRAILEGEGYVVETAASGEEALQSVQVSRPDLLIVDVIMPGMTGLDLLLHLRSDLAPPIPPVIVCSGFESTEEEALRSGAIAFLRKPFDVDDLLLFVRLGLRGEKPGAGLSEVERAHATALRRGAEQAANAAIQRLALSSVGDTRQKLGWIAGYFGFRFCGIVLLREGRLEVVGASDAARFAVGTLVGDQLPFCAEIVETGSALLLADIAAHPSFAARRSAFLGFRAFAGVPLSTEEHVAIGAICLIDDTPRKMSAEDACMLELIGRRGSALLTRAQAEEGTPEAEDVPGLFVAASFRGFLDMELRLAHRLGHALEIALLEPLPHGVVRSAVELLEAAPGRERLALGLLEDRRIAIYKRDATAEGAADALEHALGVFRRLGARVRVGAVSLSVPAVLWSEREVVAMVRQLLDYTSKNTVRVVYREDLSSWAAMTAEEGGPVGGNGGAGGEHPAA